VTEASIADVLARRARFAVECSRAEDLADRLPDGCANLLWMDIPYHRAIDASWDNVWPTDAAFLAWVGDLCKQWRRILAANGSLYVFASPAMAHAVETVVRQSFEVLTNIRWVKPAHSTKAEMFVKEDLRSPFPASETILFCEQRGSDATALDASGYGSKCEAAKQSVIGVYLRSEFARAGLTNKQIAALFPSKTGGLTGCVSNWLLGFNMPTAEQYAAMRVYADAEGAAKGRPYLRHEYEDLRREYEDLRREYEDLRRPFFATAERPYTDVWTYPTVQAYEGKHPCEKPPEMCEHAVLTSSRPDDLVVDLFCGSGGIGSAAEKHGRRFIGGDADPHWSDFTRRRVEMTRATGQTAVRKVVKARADQPSLFDRLAVEVPR